MCLEHNNDLPLLTQKSPFSVIYLTDIIVGALGVCISISIVYLNFVLPIANWIFSKILDS